MRVWQVRPRNGNSGVEFSRRKGRASSKFVADARRAVAWKMVGGEKDVKARLVAGGYQGAHLRGGLVALIFDPLTFVPPLLSPLKHGLVGAWTATMPVCGQMVFATMLFFALPLHGILLALAIFGNCALLYGPNDAPAAFRETLRRFLFRPNNSLARAGSKFLASSFGPCRHFIFRGGGGAVGAITTHIDSFSVAANPIPCRRRATLRSIASRI